MIIGVDAGALSISDDRLKVGVWRVADNLIRELLRIDKINTYRLYSFRPVRVGGQNVVLPQKGFFRFFLPLELLRRPPDVFLGLSQALPSFAMNSIGFVYDLGFLHAPTAYPDSYAALKKQTHDLVKRANRIVTISNTTVMDITKTYGILKEKITVCYPGVSGVFSPDGKKYTSGRPYFLFVGALKRGKNIPFLLRAFDRFRRQEKKRYDLYLVGGDYWPDPAIEETIQNLSLGDQVRRLGVVSDTTLASLYRGATALIISSFHEGFCLPVVEAMACGCPVIATDGGAIPEIIGDAGMIVKKDNEAGFARAFSAVLEMQTLRQKGLVRSRLFSWTKMAEAVLCAISS